ncbi:subclass B3 metallo-beta-lactamase [Sphingomonas sp. CCH5-D11]|uniref:subclass B3 metallo-beta-lactamase n=1 Tax=Sphingomonas sp. CCH5-D11 TaxID=1768786 RepID=UPI000836EEF9|nr:subclass B3 metallo-beta-lactamase [Sphingomonas sp. CCH5-D11]
MFIRSVISASAALLCTAAAQGQDDPLTRPLAVARESTWLAPRPPIRVFGNSYLVGFGGLSVALIDTGKGLILIDGALPQAAPAILANVSRLGFRPRDIKYILSTEPHFDHAGGIAALARDTDATVVASARGAEGLRTGRLAADDPQLGYDSRFPAVTPDLATVRAMGDGEVLRLGNVAITARATPGHTAGSMSWGWQSCEGKNCKSLVFASSLNPVSADGYRYTSAAGETVVAGFRRSHEVMRTIPCDILISAHADQDGATERFLTRPGACRAYGTASERALARRLTAEAAR